MPVKLHTSADRHREVTTVSATITDQVKDAYHTYGRFIFGKDLRVE